MQTYTNLVPFDDNTNFLITYESDYETNQNEFFDFNILSICAEDSRIDIKDTLSLEVLDAITTDIVCVIEYFMEKKLNTSNTTQKD